MPSFSPEQLARWTGGSWSGPCAAPVTGFATDTRQLKPGQAFVALKTDKRDGHDFLAAAAAAGASTAIVSRRDPVFALTQLLVPDPLAAFQAIAREHRRRFAGKVIGITGSCGKTSTKELLLTLLGGESAGVLATEGNLNNHIGVPLTLTKLDLERHTHAVVEAGISAPGEMKVLASMIEPDASIVTLIAPAHLMELGGLEGVAREKAVLPASVPASGLAIFPEQCASFSSFDRFAARRLVVFPVKTLPLAVQEEGYFYFANAVHDGKTRLAVLAAGRPVELFELRKVSAGMAQNAALALAAALWLGVEPELLRARLAAWRPAHWRGEIVQDAGRMVYLDCYNANPASMKDALANFCEVAPSAEPRLFVLGSMEELGPESGRFHTELGAALPLRSSDRVLAVGAHGEELREGLLKAGASAAQLRVAAGAEEIASEVRAWRGSIFIKGSRKYRLETVLSETAGSH